MTKPYQGSYGRFRCRRRILFSAGTRAIIIRRKSQWVTLLFSNQREAARAWGRHRLTTARSSFSPVFGKNAIKTRAAKQNARAAFREGDRGKAAASRAAVRKNKIVRASRLRRGQARPPARVRGRFDDWLSILRDLLDRADDRLDALFRIRPVALIDGQGADDHKSLRFRRNEPQVLRWIVFVVLGLDDFQLCGG